jgi:predicted nucleotidyltransferase
MKQLQSISQLKKLLPGISGLEGAILYGSFGRNAAGPNSDIDIQIIVNDNFVLNDLIDALQKEFHSEIQSVLQVALRSKMVVYFKTQPKIEFAICTDLSEIDRNYLGSEITNVTETILFERQPAKFGIETYLTQLVNEHNQNKPSLDNRKQVSDLIDKFVYEFESCSAMHRRSDGYQFYFFYNIALQIAIQLNHLSKGFTKFNFLPKYFIANVLTRSEQETFYDLRGSLFLPEANQQKRKLLDFFYASVERLETPERIKELEQFCEWIYSRDFFWNFRDISSHNPKIKSGRIFRTATMTLFQGENRFDQLLDEKSIKTVIDLRADQEIEAMPYLEAARSKFRYVKAQLDPWNQPDWFKQSHHQGTNEEIAYRFFALGCNEKFKNAIQAILEEETGAVAIHCFAGKDRTGIFISMLHLLAESPLETIHADYLASEVDVNLNNLGVVLDIIKERGGIEPYLLSCGISASQLQKLKQKLMH